MSRHRSCSWHHFQLQSLTTGQTDVLTVDVPTVGFHGHFTTAIAHKRRKAVGRFLLCILVDCTEALLKL
ncbi:hypothetical protein [Leptothermofonsia sp. ETS-13]|uniref:hypothetical protein n=1 Tax=Leptothermofonsia sp. ETS-13 TaxID=3035696 RepID=UPI003BA1E163